MGFFTSLVGGSKQKSSSKTGYGALPKFAQSAYHDLVNQVTPLFANGAGTSAYTPLAQTPEETQAYNMFQTPTTQQGVSDLTNNFLNPFTQYLTDNINQNYNQQGSSYLSSLANAGQMGTNREYINGAYNDQLRNQAIGSTLGNQYFQAQGNALSQNQLTASNLLQQGTNQRTLASNTAQAPMNALQAFGQLLGLFPNSANTSGTQSSTNGLLPAIGSLGIKF